MTAALAESPDEPEDEHPSVPVAWRPTVAEPVPVVRCTVIKKDGDRCRRWSLRGATVCVVHGGQLPPVREKAEAIVESARMRLVQNTDKAVDVLEELMQPGTSENVRLKAATEVLDRSGVRGGYEVDTKTEITVSPSEELASRLTQLRRRSVEAQERLSDVFGSQIIDGEVVSDEDAEADPEPDQQTLFDL